MIQDIRKYYFGWVKISFCGVCGELVKKNHTNSPEKTAPTLLICINCQTYMINNYSISNVCNFAQFKSRFFIFLSPGNSTIDNQCLWA